jgi:hypothetical protein
MADVPEWAVAGATLLLAVATFGIVWRSWGVAKATGDAAGAAADEAKASRDLIDEIKTDRQLNWRPYLFLTQSTRLANEPGKDDYLDFQNLGRGPAFNCIYARYSELQGPGGQVVPEWRSHKEPGVIGPASGYQASPAPQAHPIPMHLFQDDDGRMADKPIALLYQDTLSNNAYRLLPPRAKPDIWKPGDRAQQWVTWYFGWLGVQELPSR